jgi:hypothetical protein
LIGKRKQYAPESPPLTVLRKQFSFLLSRGRYKEANEVSRQVDELTKVEEAEDNAVMQKDSDEALLKLQEKQTQEHDTFEAEARQERRRLAQHRAIAGRLLEHRGRRPRGEVPLEHDQFWNFQVERTAVHHGHGYRYASAAERKAQCDFQVDH